MYDEFDNFCKKYFKSFANSISFID